MVINNYEKDVKILCIQEETNLSQLAIKTDMRNQYVSTLIKKQDTILNKTFVRLLEGLGYDIELVYRKRGDSK